MRRLELEHQSLEVEPRLGGAVLSYTWHSKHVLRDSRTANHPFETAAFPMIPFSGRIANGKFQFAKKSIALDPNFLPEPHAIHGQCWLKPWRVTEQTDHSIELARSHDGTDWPWTYEAKQHLSLGDSGLSVRLALTNTSPYSMPAGLGWHPYFPSADAFIKAPTTRVWKKEDASVGPQPEAISQRCSLCSGQKVEHLDFDDCFSLARPEVQIDLRPQRLRVRLQSSSNLKKLVVYTPAGEDFFCVEPASHAPDAVNSPLPRSETGLHVLRPGETMTCTSRLLVEAR